MGKFYYKLEGAEFEEHHFYEVPMDINTMDDLFEHRNYWPDTLNISREQLQKYKRALGELTPKQRQIVELTLAGLTQVQIAAKLNITQGAVSLAFSGSDGHGGIIRRLKHLIKMDEKYIECALCKVPKLKKEFKIPRNSTTKMFCDECRRYKHAQRVLRYTYKKKESS